MQVEPVITSVRAALDEHVALAGLDESVEAAATAISRALTPVLRQCALDLAAQAAAEVGAQLGDRAVEVVLIDGDPTLRVTDALAVPVAGDEDLEARLTLRLPPSLKRVVEEAASDAGDSVNTWVVEALSSRTARPRGRRHVTGSFEL